MPEKDKESSLRCLLISMPTLQDPFFFHTTSLLAEFNKEGAMGIVLNRPLNMKLTQILEPSLRSSRTDQIQVFWGGPVQNDRGWILHEDEALASESLVIEPGLFMSSSVGALTKLLARDDLNSPPRFRFFLGYAGWNPGQLEQEMAASSWVTAPIHRTLLFDTIPDTVWERSLQSLGVNPASLASADTSNLN